MGIKINGKADIIVVGGENNVDIEEEPKIILRGRILIRLEETAKVKELERISDDTKEADNSNDIMEGNVKESMKAKAKDKYMIITDEVISSDNKDEIRNNVERNSNINIK